MAIYRARAIAEYLLDAGTITGSGNVWADGSDDTYITIDASGNDPIAKRASGNVESRASLGLPPVPTLAKVYVRYRVAPEVLSRPSFPSGSIIMYGNTYLHSGDVIADPVSGWLRTVHTSTEPINAWNGGSALTCQINAPFGVFDPCKVLEAEIIFEWFTEAPPCRLIRRGDHLDPGGARLYPPSKMQQTSSRGRTAY